MPENEAPLRTLSLPTLLQGNQSVFRLDSDLLFVIHDKFEEHRLLAKDLPLGRESRLSQRLFAHKILS
jgi:hypothetical protein